MKTAHSIVTVSLLIGVAAFIGGCRDRDRSFDSERAARSDDKQEQNQKLKPPADQQDRAGSATLTSAAWVSNDSAAERITSSRCAREMTCANVGPDKHFVTGDACLFEVRMRAREDLKSSECPAGIDGPALDKCLDAIRSESCTNPLETVTRLATCRAGALCLKSETLRKSINDDQRPN